MNSTTQFCRQLYLYTLVCLILVCFNGPVISGNVLLAQGSAQVTISGIPPVLTSPYVSDVEQNYLMGQYQFQLMYNNTNPEPVEFVYDVTFVKDGEEIASIISDPVTYTPGTYLYRTFDDDPRVNFQEDVLNQMPRRLQTQVIREGIIPEGSYLLEIEARPVDDFVNISSIPGIAPFEVRFPQPPVITSPPDEGFLSPEFTVFSWTPVVGAPGFSFEYELTIVRVERGQSPYDAIESNPVIEQITTTQTQVVYTREFYQLEDRQRYAWQVRARDVDGILPISDDGRTEVYSFTVGDYIGEVNPDDLQSIPLIPDFAELVNLDRLDIEISDNAITLNGNATLVLNFLTDRTRTNVQLLDLQIQPGDLTNPVIMGGEVAGRISSDVIAFPGVSDIVRLNEIHYGLGDGLTVRGDIINPLGTELETSGSVQLTQTGLTGQLEAARPTGDPLVEVGGEPFKVNLFRLVAYFPQMDVLADANLEITGQETPCVIPYINFVDSPVEMDFSCLIEDDIALIPGTDLATLYLNIASGSLSFVVNSPSFDYDVSMYGSLQLEALDDRTYNLGTSLQFSSVDGVRATVQPPQMTMPRRSLDLGIGQLVINRVQEPALRYDPGNGQWNFTMDMAADLKFRDLDDLTLPEVHGITLDRDGIHFPEINFDEDDLYFVPDAELGGFSARLLSFTVPEFTFPWFDWDQQLPGPWDFAFDFEVTFPDMDIERPSCLRNLTLTVYNAIFSDAELSAVFPTTSFDEGACSIELVSDYALDITQLSGEIHGYVSADEFFIDGNLLLDGAFHLGEHFACDDEWSSSVGIEGLALHGDGLFEGELTDIVPPCPLAVGPFSGSVNESNFVFARGGDDQLATLDGAASLTFESGGGPGNLTVTGDFGLNLITGKFTELMFVIDEPFLWDIPQEEPVLTFLVENAEIDTSGLLIDGRSDFMVGDHSIGVTFDNVLVDLYTMRLESGEIIFDDVFALQAGIDQQDLSLTYESLPVGSELTLDPGVYLELAGNVIIDEDGLRANGEAAAQFTFGDFQHDDLTVEFSDDFAFGLDPFGVRQGYADIRYDGGLIARIDKHGIHPSLDFFDPEDILPDRISMPKETIAYLEIRQDDELVVEVQQEAELAISISTKPGMSANFVFPALQGDRPEPPKVSVEFSDIVFGVAPFHFQSGLISVDLPPGDDKFDLEELGVPLQLENITYGDLDVGNTTVSGLFLSGTLVLFEQDLGEGSEATFYVNNTGTVIASVEMTDLGSEVHVVEGSDIVRLHIDSISGDIEIPLITGDIPDFNLEIDGGFEIHGSDDHTARANVTAQLNRFGLSLTSFEYDHTGESPEVDFGSFRFEIEEIEELDLSYDRDTGFDFYAKLDFNFGFEVEDGERFSAPLRGVEIRPSGFVIPEQEVNEDMDPALDVPPLAVAGAEVEFHAFRIDDVVVDIYDFSPGDLLDIVPRVDLSLSLPAFQESAPALANVSLSANDVGLSDGIFIGTLVAHTPFDDVVIPLGNPNLNITKFEGEFDELDIEGQRVQGLAIDIEGDVTSPEIFESDEPCDPVEFSLSIVRGEGFEGVIGDFVPCGVMPIGPLSLEMLSSEVRFDYEDELQTAELEGTAQLNIPHPDNPDQSATVTGGLTIDFINGSIRDGLIAIEDPFPLQHPWDDEDALFSFVVEEAALDSSGLMLKAEGEMEVTDDVSINVNFNDLLLDPDQNLRIIDGNAVLSSDFSFEIEFSPVEWRVVDTGSDLPEDKNVVRLNLSETGIVLDKDGLSLSGTSTADLRLAEALGQDDDPDDPEDEYRNLRLELVDNFTLNFPPVHATQGKAELWYETQEGDSLLAWYDTEGLHLGDLFQFISIPDSIGLPHPSIAYLYLKDDDGEPVVEMESEGGVYTLSTKPGESVDLVIAALTDDDGNHPTFATEFSVSVNSSFEIVDGSIGVELHNNPYQLPDMPLTLTALEYEKRDDGTYALTAQGQLELPEALDDVVIAIDELRFSQEGFEQATFAVGDIDDRDADPIVSNSFANDEFVFNVLGAEVGFGDEQEFTFAGNIESSLLTDIVDDETVNVPLHYTSEWGSEWSFSFDDIEHFENDPLVLLYLQLTPTDIGVTVSQDLFAVDLSGKIGAPELLGEDFEVTVYDLSLGTDGISVGDVDAQSQSQEFELFDGIIKGEVTSFASSYENDVFYVNLDGNLEVFERTAEFQQLRIGSDRSVTVEDGVAVNILDERVELIGEYLAIDELIFGINDDQQFYFAASGDSELPYPFEQTADFAINVVQTGPKNVEVDTDFPDITFAVDPMDISNCQVGFGLDDLGTACLTGATVDFADLRDISTARFYATASVYIWNEEEKHIEFGKPGNMKAEYGFKAYYDDGPVVNWNITDAPTPSNPLFDFDYRFFRFTIESIAPPEDDSWLFGVQLSGSLGMTVSGVAGADASFAEFTVGVKDDENVDVDWGELTSLNFTVMGIATLSLDTFDFGSGPITIEKPNAPVDEPPDPDGNGTMTADTTIMTERYMTVEGAELSLTANYGGDVKEVLFYETSNGRYLSIKDFNLAFGEAAHLNLSLQYIQDGPNFSFLVAGRGEFRDTGLGGVGSISNLGGELSFGVFIRVDEEIEIIPPLKLTSVGGGFFYQPNEDDFDAVKNVTAIEYGNNPAPSTADVTYSVLVFAEMELLEGVAEGRALLVMTLGDLGDVGFEASLYANVDMLADLMDGILYLNVSTHPASLSGNIDLTLKIPPSIGDEYLIQGENTIGFYVVREDGNTIWAVYGDVDLRVLILGVDGSFFVGNDGLYANVRAGLNVDRTFIKVDVGFDLEFWYMSASSDIGMYAELWANVTLLRIFSAGADIRAAYISRDKLLYGAVTAHYTNLIGRSRTREGSVSRKDGSWSASRSRNEEYEQLISDARSEAQDMQESAEEAAGQVAAGLDEMQQLEAMIEQIEEEIMSRFDVATPYEEMQTKIAEVEGFAGDVQQQLNNAVNEAIILEEEVYDLLADIESIQRPVSVDNMPDADGNGINANPVINLDDNQANQNIATLEELQENAEEIDQYYRDALEQAWSNLALLENLLEGQTQVSLLALNTIDRFWDVQVNPAIYQFLPGDYNSTSSNPSSNSSSDGSYFNRFAHSYTEAVEAINRFYANAISVGWVYSVYADDEDLQEQAAQHFIAERIEQYEDIFSSIVNSHREFSNTLNHLYTIKANMLATIYGMIEEYQAFRDEILDDDESGDLAEQKQELAELLEPPVVSTVEFSATLPFVHQYYGYKQGYGSHAVIDWDAYHPAGVVENAFHINDFNSTQSLWGDEFLSAGEKSSLLFKTFKREEDEIERDYSIDVRARGAGGVTLMRTANFTLAVDPEGDGTSPGEILPEDVDPPSNPTVSLPYNSTSSYTTAPGPGGQMTLQLFSVYWTNDPSQIDLTIEAYDYESDIATFEYALGTSVGGTDVVDWTVAQGVRPEAASNTGSANTVLETAIRGLDLEHVQSYYISVRATNGAGLQSTTEMVSPIRYDSTPPEAPPEIETTTMLTALIIQSTDPVEEYDAVFSEPGWEYQLPMRTPQGTYYPPKISIEWEDAQDPESGIYEYHYVLSEYEESITAFSDAQTIYTTNDTEFTHEGPPLTFRDSIYVHVRAKNYAGSIGDAAIFGPIVPSDTHRPTYPAIRARVLNNDLRAYLTALSYDLGSGVSGYRFSVGTSPGATDVRSWSYEVELEHIWEETMADFGGGVIVPAFDPVPDNPPEYIFDADELNLPETNGSNATTVYINVQGIDNQGNRSSIVSSGPVVFGSTPAVPGVLVNITTFDRIDVSVSDVFDASSQIDKVEIRYIGIYSGEVYLDWQTVGGVSGFYPSPLSFETSETITGVTTDTDLRVEVRVTNGAGEQNIGSGYYYSPETLEFIMQQGQNLMYSF